MDGDAGYEAPMAVVPALCVTNDVAERAVMLDGGIRQVAGNQYVLQTPGRRVTSAVDPSLLK